jgi:hypothetical protein
MVIAAGERGGVAPTFQAVALEFDAAFAGRRGDRRRLAVRRAALARRLVPAHPGRHAGGSRSAPHAAPRRVRRDRRGAQPVTIVTAGRYHIRLPPDQLVIGDTK